MKYSKKQIKGKYMTLWPVMYTFVFGNMSIYESFIIKFIGCKERLRFVRVPANTRRVKK